MRRTGPTPGTRRAGRRTLRAWLSVAVVATLMAFGLATDAAASVSPTRPTAGDRGALGTTGTTESSASGAAAAPALRLSVDVEGGYVAAGVGLRNRGFGSVRIAGIPRGATVVQSYLYWSILDTTERPSFKSGVVNSRAVTGTLIGSGPDPCWDVGSGFAYRADVTSIVNKNGSYRLSRFASGRRDGADPSTSEPVLPLEGASLVVIFSKTTAPAYPLTRVQLYDGYAETAGRKLAMTASWLFPATNPVPRIRTTFIGADGQSADEPGSGVNGHSLPVDWDGTDPQAGPPYSRGNLWDTGTTSIGRYVDPGDTEATLTVTGGPDCLVWVAQVLSVGWSGSVDTDGDALLDGWEANGYDADGDGSVDIDLPARGASIVRKDVFVEMDYMGAEESCPCHLPLAADLRRIVRVFATSPHAENPNGRRGIALHLDAGAARGEAFDLGGGNLVAHAKIFHYMVWAHGYAGDSSSGLSFGIPADSFIVTLGLWPDHGSSDEQVGTFVHELGHNLGLGHGGGDFVNYKPNYLSVMSYAFQVTGVPRTGTLAPYFGYSRADLPDLVEGSLDESVGLNSPAASTYRTRWFCPNGFLTTPGTADGPVDWNCDDAITSSVSVDLNGDGFLDTLAGWRDWGSLVYDGGALGPGARSHARQQAPPRELTREEFLRIAR